MIVFRYLAFALLIALVVYQSFVIRRLTRRLKETNSDLDRADEELDRQIKTLRAKLDSQDEIISDCIGRALRIVAAQSNPAEIRECDEFSRFEVIRQHDDVYIVCKIIEYDPSDPDDREYKRIHAEEVAEILNEKP